MVTTVCGASVVVVVVEVVLVISLVVVSLILVVVVFVVSISAELKLEAINSATIVIVAIDMKKSIFFTNLLRYLPDNR